MTGFQTKRAVSSVAAMMPKKKYRFWVEQTNLYEPVNRAYLDWLHSPIVGKKYVWFEHHSEIILGFKCRVDIDDDKITDIAVIDPKKFMLFELKYSV